MRRVLHTIDTTGPGGAETVFTGLIEGLEATRFHSIAAIPGPGWVANQLKRKGIRTSFIHSRGGNNVQYLLDLLRIILANKIQIIQSHLLGSNVYSSLAGLLCGIPVVSTFHGFVDLNTNERNFAAKKMIINSGSKKIVFVSKSLKSHYVDFHGLSGRKSMTIYNGIDQKKFYPEKSRFLRDVLKIDDSQVVIGCIGNIRPAKGYERFIKAARNVKHQNKKCKFVIVGHGKKSEIDALIKLRQEMRLEEDLFLLGFQSDVSQLINGLDLYVLPSVSEGFSLSVIEAMACGVPVLATRSGGPEEIINDGIDGLIVENSENGISAGIMEMLKSPGKRDDFARRGRETFMRQFTREKMILNYSHLLQG